MEVVNRGKLNWMRSEARSGEKKRKIVCWEQLR